ncbi:MAG TPA: FAD-dependent oxidoreductase [Thermomicrobiaceae bacterium]|nr:FAD-dependent oxidoreductase [Thermomicrobiaceae bacterium]
MESNSYPVVIVGAGPYGLAATRRLRAEGIEVKTFGEAMSFWRCHMPAGMLLRSSYEASNIGSRHGPLTLDAFQRARGLTLGERIPLPRFVEYGEWFQQQVVPDLDGRRIECIRAAGDGFQLALSDGERAHTRRLILATGLACFPNRPALFDGLSPRLVSHAADRNDLSGFSGHSVAVIGGGQSAVETSVILAEAGAEVELIARTPAIRWLTRSSKLHTLPTRAQHALYAPTDVGPPGLSWLVAMPELFTHLPRGWQDKLAYRSIRPAASGWLRPRSGRIRFSTGRAVQAAEPQGSGLRLALDDGSERAVDHALLATGYRVDVRRYDFLAPELAGVIRQVNGYPVLGPGFESSVPGLHFIGAPAAYSFGPVVRFVSGTWFTSRELARTVTRKAGAA